MGKWPEALSNIVSKKLSTLIQYHYFIYSVNNNKYRVLKEGKPIEIAKITVHRDFLSDSSGIRQYDVAVILLKEDIRTTEEIETIKPFYERVPAHAILSVSEC